MTSSAMTSPLKMKQKTPFAIGVAGSTASGKSSICAEIARRLRAKGLGARRVALLSQDSFYRDLTNDADREKAARRDFNFDHPDALDMDELVRALSDLKQGRPVCIPKYDFRTNSRLAGEGEEIEPADVILVEGILLRSLFDLKLFMDVDADICLSRRIERDISERGRALDGVLHQYFAFAKPAFEEFCLPTKQHADLIIPRGADNEMAVSLIVKHVYDLLRTSPKPEKGMKSPKKAPTKNLDRCSLV